MRPSESLDITASQRRRRAKIRLSTVALLLLAVHCQRAPDTKEAVHSLLQPPEGTRFTAHQPPILSPDGRTIAIVADSSEGVSGLWHHRLEDAVSRALPGTEGASYPFWSPDSESLGYFAEGKLAILRISSGESQTICDAPEGRGGTWSDDGTILFTPRVGEGLFRVAASGGLATEVTRLDPWREEASHRWPWFLPDGRHFLFFIVSGRLDTRGVYLGSIDASSRWRILSTNSSAAYVSSGHLLFVRDRDLVAQPFDGERFELKGAPLVVDRDVGNTPYLRGNFSVSETHVLLYGNGSERSELLWRDRNGETLSSLGPSGNATHLRLSPNGKTVAVTRIDPVTVTSDIWLVSVEDGRASQLTLALGEDGDPVWSPDGQRVVFASNRNGTFDLYQKDMSGDVEILYRTRADTYPTDWSQDGRIIVFARRSERGDLDLWSLNVDDGDASPIVQTPFDERRARLAPDGRWIAYTSNESGRSEITIQPFPNLDAKRKVSAGGGYWPSWRGDGKELFYVSEDGNLMAVPIGDSFRASRPEILFPTSWDGASLVTAKPYAVTADGKRFLLSTPASRETDVSYTVVHFWTSRLR